MKKMIYLVLVLISIGTMVSCEKKSEGKTQITIYAELELIGNESMALNIGGTYVEPGYKATLNGADVTSQVTVTDNIDPEEVGIYTVTYSIKNADGFEASKQRTVYVYNTADPIEGVWECTPTSYRDNGGTIASFGDAYQMFITNNGDGTYDVEDLICGWYAQRAGYGADCAMWANINIEGDAITLNDSYVPYWEDAADGLENGTYDSAKSQMYYEVAYAGTMVFYITLNKVIFE